MVDPLEAATAAALAEHAKWGTGCDSRRPREHWQWVGREAEPGIWDEKSSHPDHAAAQAALKPQAMKAAVSAAISAWLAAKNEGKGTCPFNDPTAAELPEDFSEADPCPVCGDLGTWDADNLARPSRCVSTVADRSSPRTGPDRLPVCTGREG